MFKEQAYGRDRDLTDVLTDLHFSQTKDLGSRTAVLGSPKGTSTGEVGVSCHSKGKESQVSCALCSHKLELPNLL